LPAHLGKASEEEVCSHTTRHMKDLPLLTTTMVASLFDLLYTEAASACHDQSKG